MFTSTHTILLVICLSICLGFLIGTILVIYTTAKEIKALENELDKFRQTNQELIKRWKDKYVDDGTDEY